MPSLPRRKGSEAKRPRNVKGTCMPGYAIDGGAAVHIVNGKYHKSLQFYPDSHVYQVSCKDNIVEEQKMKMVEL